jgi:hypothetical protein
VSSGGGEAVAGSPFPVRVVAGPPVAANCEATLDGLANGRLEAGGGAVVTLLLRDAFGNQARAWLLHGRLRGQRFDAGVS